MTETAASESQAIRLEDVFPHAPTVLWRALTDGALMARWLMAPTGFRAEVGPRFTCSTRPAGDWNGTISCEVLEVVAERRLAFSWCSGHRDNEGYGATLETVVTFTLTPVEAGTRLSLVHAGFLPRNDTAYRSMGEGWKTVLTRLDAVAAEGEAPPAAH